jgi:sulfate transport system ATP-binding protein
MSIVLENLVKRYGATPVVDHVSLEIEDGELFVLLGASGSGKSTILRIIAGLFPADEGTVWLHGRDVTNLSPQQRNVGFVFQNYSLFRHMTVAENIEFGLEIRKVPKAQRAAKRDELLELIGLAGLGGRNPRQLSGGQQQRVAVARALAFEPSVLLLDEPFGALDVKIRIQLRQTLKAVQRRLGVTTILVTHDQEEAFELADRIGVVERGRLLEVGPPVELYRRPKHEFVAQFLGSANLFAGNLQENQLHLGSLVLPVPPSLDDQPSEGQVAVLFRPEDLTLLPSNGTAPMPVLGRGEVEGVQFLGTLQRVQVRLQPLPGIRPLVANYGQADVRLQVAHLSRADDHTEFQVGQPVSVGIQSFHLLPRAAPRLLLCIDETCDKEYIASATTMLPALNGGSVTVFVVAGSDAAAQQCLTDARASLSGLPAVTFKARRGTPASEVLREVHEGNYDLAIVRGTALGRLDRSALAEEVVQQASIPVLVVKGERPALRRLLLCTAGGEPGKLDVLFGGRVARRVGATTTLLHIASPQPQLVAPALVGEYATAPVLVESPNGRVARHLEQGAQTLQSYGVRAEVKTRQGAVLDEILTEAREGDYDLVVVGGHLSTNTFRESNIAADVVRLADRPVLVVRGPLN